MSDPAHSDPGATPPAAPAAGEAAAPNRGMITVAVMGATLLQVLDTTIVNVALPHMQGTLSATVDQMAWVLTSYIVASAVMTPPTGWLASRVGRKRLLLLSVAGFTAFSALCGLAFTLGQMVLYRLGQGIFGAALSPLAQATMLDTYPRHKHGQAMAIYGMGLMVGPILGPTLGGYLTETYNWRWVFFINVPAGLLCLLLTMTFVPETQLDRERPFDLFGFSVLSLCIGALQLMLDRGQSADWFNSREIILEACLAFAGLYIFLVHSFTTSRPFLDFSIFRDRNFSAGVVFMFCAGMILFATLALMPPFMANVLGFPILTVGLTMAPRGVATLIGMAIVGRLISRMDTRWLIGTGLAMLLGSFWIMTGFTTEVTPLHIILPGLVQGAGLGLMMIPMMTVAFSTLPAHLRNEATAMFNLMRNMGGSIGISIMFTFLTRNIQVNRVVLSRHINPYNPVLRRLELPHGGDPTSPAGLKALNGRVGQQASMLSYLADFRLMMTTALLLLPLLLLFRSPRHQPEQPTQPAGE